jgi:hypothetical protein
MTEAILFDGTQESADEIARGVAPRSVTFNISDRGRPFLLMETGSPRLQAYVWPGEFVRVTEGGQ